MQGSLNDPCTIESSKIVEPLEMSWNEDGNARKRLNDYARPVLQRLVTLIHRPLNRGANFRIDSHVMSMLPIFHGKPTKDL